MAKSTDDQDQVGHPKEKNHDLSKNARVRQSLSLSYLRHLNL